MPQSIILNLHIIYVFKSFHLNFLTCMDSVSSCSSLEMMGNCVKFVRIASLLSSWMICSSQYNKNCFFNFSTQNCTENWTDTKYDMSLFWSLLHLWFYFLLKIIQEIWNLALGTSLLWSRSKMQHTTDVAFNATRFFYTERDDWAILKEVEVMTSNWSNYDTNRCSFWIFEF